MENRKNIINELKELSPVLAQNNPVTPYEVPHGYFENLPEAILTMVQSEEATPVLPISKQNPYSVPNGYFENLADTILTRINTEKVRSAQDEIEALSPVLGKLNKSNPYTLPAGYFEELATNITDGAKAIELVNEELENLSPLMLSLKNKNVYEAPEGYFNTLANSLLAKSKQQQPAKVVSMNFGRKMLRYAAAAVVAAVVLVSGWMYVNKTSVTGKTTDETIAKELNEKVKKVSDDELIKFIEDDNTAIDDNTVAAIQSSEIDASDMKDMLADISDEELQQYLEDRTPVNNNSRTN
jgi:hypothetical protein